jgi:FkbM family methyltransferase
MLPSAMLKSRGELEAVCRQHARSVILGKQRVACRVLGQHMLFGDSLDVGIVPHLAMDGFWEAWISLFMARTIQPGWHCVDVGANFGYYTLLMADQVGKDGRVLCIEPNADLAANYLPHTIHNSGMADRIELVQAAASDHDGVAQLTTYTAHCMNGTITLPSANLGHEAVAYEVPTVRLDTVLRGWNRLDFLKIDAEASEYDIWNGMTECLRRFPDVRILMEFNFSRFEKAEDFLVLLAREFPLRYIDTAGSVQPTTATKLADDQPTDDWMLWLSKK